MDFNNKCDSCGNELTDFFSYSGNVFSWKINIANEFLKTKGKGKEGERFQFCLKCNEEMKDFYLEKCIGELKRVNIAYSENLIGRIFKDAFNNPAGFEKFQKALVSNIKKNIGEWEIKKVNYRPYYRGKPAPKPYTFHPDEWGEIKEMTILFHQSAKLEYDENGLCLEKSWDPRKVYFESDFSEKEWTEIKKDLETYKKEIKSKNNVNTNQVSNKQKNNLSTEKILTICGVIFLIGVVFLFVFWIRGKKKK